MGKQLSIVVGIVDKATAPLRAIGVGVGGIAGVFTKLGSFGSRAIAGIFAGLTSLRGLLLGGAIAGGVYKLISSFNATATEIDHVGKAAERLHLPIQTLSELRYAAKLSNIEFENLATGLETADKNIGQLAVTGKSRAGPAFAELGVNIRDANGQLRGMDDLLPDILDGLAASDPAKQTFLAQKIFGPDGDKFLLFLQNGTNTLRQYNEEAKRLGVVFTPEQYAAAQAYNDSISRLSSAFEGFKAVVIGQVAPALADFFNAASYRLAAFGQAFGSILVVVKNAFGGPNAAAARDAILTTVHAILDAVVAQVTTRVLALLAQVGEFTVLVLNEVITGLGNFLAEAASTTAGVVGVIVGGIKDVVLEALGRLRPALDTVGESISTVWTQAGVNVADYVDGLRTTREETGQTAVASVAWLVAIGDKWRETSDAAVQARVDYSDALAEISPITWGQITEGIRGATVELISSANDTVEAVKRGVLDVAHGIGSNLSSAIYDAISGTKSLKAAFVDFLSSTLKQVSELILQFLILRAVAGIAKGFFGAGTQDVTDLSPYVGDTPELASVSPNSGGYIAPGGSLLHFARGGIVPGTNTTRDSVPALLTSGEGVLNRTGVATLGRGNLAALNSGQGVGTSVVVNQTVVIQGGGGADAQDLRALKRASTEGVLDAIRKSPRLARDFRGAIGVA